MKKRVQDSVHWLIFAIAMALLCGCEKARLDEEARQLCAKDGGITIYETIKPAESGLNPSAAPIIPQMGRQKTNDRFAYEWNSQVLKPGNPSLNRGETRVIRLTDGKVVGRMVTYSRIGGDMPGPWHESHFLCPENVEINALLRAVFANE